MKDNKDFYNWYKTKITENTQDPPDDAWQNISDELDTNDVWDRIAVELDTPRAWWASKTMYYALPVLLLLLSSGGAYYYYLDKSDYTSSATTQIAVAEDQLNTASRNEPVTENPANASFDMRSQKSDDNKSPQTKPAQSKDLPAAGNETLSATEGESNPAQTGEATAITSGHKEASVTEKDTSANSPADHGEKMIAVNRDQDAGDEHEDELLPETNSDSFEERAAWVLTSGDEREMDHREVALTEETAAGSADISQQFFTSLSHSRASIQPVVMPDSMLNIYPVTASIHPDSLQRIAVAEAPQKHTHDKTFEFGLTASAKNTWLLNRRTLAGLEKHTLNTTLPDFGKDIGLMFAWNFSPALSAQAEGMFLSEAGQRYKEYRNGKYVDREVDLRYYSLNVLLKYRLNKAIAGHSVNGSALIAGFYGSRLNKATEIINGEISDSRPAYHDHNYGVIVGYEYNRYVLPNVILSSGLRMNYGFPNIDTSIFSTTFTGSVDLNIAVKYRLGGK